MSDSYSFDTPYTPDIERLVNQAQSAYDAYPSPEKADAVQREVAATKGREIAEKDPIRDRQIGRLRSDLGNVDRKYRDIQPLQSQPWRPDDHPISNPLEAFGSYAGVFAMVASAATRQPIENTLNAGAAAINSVRNADLASYERAHTAWKENFDQSLKVHQAEREDYKDAIENMKAGKEGADAELTAVSAKYGDKIIQQYLAAGMNKEAMDIIAKRADLADKLLTMAPQLQEIGQKQYENVLFQSRVKEINADREREGQPRLNGQELVQLRGEIKQQFGGAGADVDRIRLRELQDRGIKEENDNRARMEKPPLSAEEEARLRGNIARLSQQNLGAFSGAKDVALTIRDRADALYKKAEAEGNPISYDQAYTEAKRQVTVESSTVTPNERQKIQSHIDLIDESTNTIERVEGTLEKYVGAAGAPGRALRLKERLSNLIGSNQSDRVQMERDIEYLRLNATRLLTNTAARPMAADAARINQIVAGLQWGDTGANTIRAMEEIKGIYARSRAQAMLQLEGRWQPGGSSPVTAAPGSATPSPARTKRNPWDDDPVIK